MRPRTTTTRRSRGARRARSSLRVSSRLPRCRAAGAARSSTRSIARRATHVETLASDRLEGRLAGSNGERLAADYLVARAEAHRREAAARADATSACRSTFTAGTKDGGSTIGAHAATPATARERSTAAADVQALSFSDNGEVDAARWSSPATASSCPRRQDFGYDSYADARREGQGRRRAALLPRGRRSEDARRSSRATPTCATRRWRRGSAARRRMLVVTGPRSPNAGETGADDVRHGARRLGHRRREHQRRRRGADLRRRPASTLEAVQKALDTGNPHVAGFAIPERHASRSTPAVVREKQTGHNVVAYLPATAPTTGVEQAVGRARRALRSPRPRRRTATRSPARTRPDQIHSAPTTTRRAPPRCWRSPTTLAKQPRRRNVLLAFWSGEELGLLGSTAFVNASRRCRSIRLAAYLNFDMVGRMQDNKLTVQATGTSPAWAKLLEQANVAAGFDLHAAGRSVSADRRRQLQPGERAVPELLHRRARRLPQAVATPPTRSTTRISIASSSSPRRSSSG